MSLDTVGYCYTAVTNAAYARDTTGCLNGVRGWSFAVLEPPTADQLVQICASAACMDIVAAVKLAAPNECRVMTVSLYKDIIDRVEATCPGKAAKALLSPVATPTATPLATPTTNNASAAPNATVTLAPTVTPVPAPVPIETKSDGLSTATIAGISGGVIVVLLLVVNMIWLLRRKRKEKLEQTTGNDGFAYAGMSDARMDDMSNDSDLLRGGLALAAVRIPLDDIELGKVVSQGGFGEVLVGKYNNTAVAIKRLLASKRKDASNIRSFFQEIQLTASLNHECIVKFIGVAWDVPADLCMVSEFMPGGDLRSLLVQFTLEGHANGHDDGKLRIAVQVAHAMTYLHSLETPVVHRDLKSRNILLTETMDAKVIDFGISCERQDVTMTAGVGTSLWMAPEVMLGKRYDEKADVFSFGVILSELDTHELPYDHAVDMVANRKMADMVLMNLICDDKVKPRFTDKAAPDMVALASDCLQVDPAKRPRASEVLRRIHLSHQHDQTLTAETRSAMESSLDTAETSTRSRAVQSP